MTTITKTPRAAFPGISIDQAVALIHKHGELWHQAPQPSALTNPDGSGRRMNPHELTRDTARRRLHQTARDCAWCITHEHGPAALDQLFKAVLKGTKDPYRYDLSRAMELAFAGICGWMV